MSHRLNPRPAQLLMAMVTGLLTMQTAIADSQRAVAPLLPTYQQECAACHLAYPPGLLPTASWKRLMATLPKHFGTDASLDAETKAAISTWLDANAGTYKRVSQEPPQDRITTSSWFVHKHREVAPAVWKRAAIGSPANCAACHIGADKGDFNDDNVRIPK